jgi:hypothetical protein
MTWYSVRTLNCPSIIRLDDENFSSEPSSVSRTFELFLVVSFRTSQQYGRTPFSVRQGKWFSSKTKIWEDNCNRPNNVCSHSDAILDKASHAYKVQLSGRQYPWSGRASVNMEIECHKSSIVRTSISMVRMLEPLYGNCVQLKCNRLNSRATSSGSGPIQVRISCEFGKPIA